MPFFPQFSNLFVAPFVPFTFLPSDIAGLSLWLKADAGVTLDGSNVTAWADQSGNGKNGTADNGYPTIVSNALNGKPVIEFNGTDARIVGSSPMNTSVGTIIIVGKYLADKLTGVMYEQYDGYDTMGFYRGNSNEIDQKLYMYNGATIVSDSNVGFVFGIFTVIVDGTNSKICINGSIDGTGNAGDLTANGPYYLSWYGGNNEYTNMQIAEVVVYNRAITTQERQQVEAYLASKYAIY
jgi:hypothetical protein